MEHIDVLNPDVTSAIEAGRKLNNEAHAFVASDRYDRKDMLKNQMMWLKFYKEKVKEFQVKIKAAEAEIQAELLQELENKNLKFVEFETEAGTASLAYKKRTEIDDAILLRTVVGSALDAKVETVTKTEVKFKDKKLEQALIALYTGDYGQMDLDVMLFGLGLDDKQIKMLLKKFKGEYKHDSALLESVGLDASELEEELDAIHDHKQWEMIQRYFGSSEKVDKENLRLAIYVEEILAFTTKFNKDEADEDSTM